MMKAASGDSVVVAVPPWHVDVAVHCAKQRLQARGRQDRPDYRNKSVLQPEPIANLAACLCELAVSLHYDRRWNGPYWQMKYHRQANVLPDVGECIEVRRTRTPVGGGVPVKQSEANKNYWLVQAYVSDEVLMDVHNQRPCDVTVSLTGQVLASVAWRNGVQRYPEKRVCPAKFLKEVNPCEVCVCLN